MGMAIIMVTTLVAVIVGSVWILLARRPKGDEDVITVKAEPKPRKKTGVGTALAMIKPDRIESEVKLNAVAAQRPKHVVVKTWMRSNSINTEEYMWECACGRRAGTSIQSLSKREAVIHVSDGNRAEELKAQTNGRFSW